MGWETVLGVRPALRVLVVGSHAGTLVASADAEPEDVLPTRVRDVPAALSALAGGRFDCVLLELGAGEPGGAASDARTVRALRERAGTAAVVVVSEDAADGTGDLEDLADLVLGRDELVGAGVGALRQASEHARLVWRLRAAEPGAFLGSGAAESPVAPGRPSGPAGPPGLTSGGPSARAGEALAPAAMFTLGDDGLVSSWTDGAAELYGYTAAEVVGRDAAVLHPLSTTDVGPSLTAGRAGGAVHGLDTVCRTRDGRLLPVTLDAAPQVDGHGKPVGWVVVTRAAAPRSGVEAGPGPDTLHDGLTGLPNGVYLSYRLSQELAAARGTGAAVAVLTADIDRFRAVDDLHGRVAGDRVLAEAADRLRALVRPTDVVARTSGDGFTLVCPDLDEAAAARLARRVVEAVRAPIELGGRTVRVDISVGVVVSPPVPGGAAALLKLADLALYEGKTRGRSQVQLFDASLAERSRELLRLSDDLRAALAEGLLEVRYQPIVDVAGRGLAGYEALARWHDPARGEVSPTLFVRVAEQNGFVTELDRWVLRTACRDAAAAIRSGDLPAGARISVNLSTHSLGDPALVPWVGDLLAAEGLPAEALVLEVTETAIARDLATASTVLAGLRALGVGIALDDFGTGYSSLSLLRELPVTQVKVDRSFVANLGTAHRGDLAITESVLDLARRLRLETVAEGVETAAQLAVLRRLGCDLAQGHLWSGAVPAGRLGLSGPADGGPDRRWRPLRPRTEPPG